MQPMGSDRSHVWSTQLHCSISQHRAWPTVTMLCHLVILGISATLSCRGEIVCWIVDFTSDYVSTKFTILGNRENVCSCLLMNLLTWLFSLGLMNLFSQQQKSKSFQIWHLLFKFLQSNGVINVPKLLVIHVYTKTQLPPWPSLAVHISRKSHLTSPGCT